MALLRDIRAFVRRDATQAWRQPGFLTTQAVLVATGAAAAMITGANLASDQPGYMGQPAAFLLTGIMVMDLIWGTTAKASLHSVDDQVGGMLDACRVTGAPLWRLIVLPQLFPTLLATARCLAYGTAGALFIRTAVHPERLPELAVAFLLAGAALAFVGVCLRCLALTLGRKVPLGLIFAAVASLLSGLFFPVSALPHAAQVAAKSLPTTHLLDAMRACMLEGAGFVDIWPSLAWLTGLAAVLGICARVTVAATARQLLRTDPTGND